MTLWQYFCLILGLSGFRKLVFGLKREDEFTKKYGFFIMVAIVLTSYFSLEYSLPIFVNLVRTTLNI